MTNAESVIFMMVLSLLMFSSPLFFMNIGKAKTAVLCLIVATFAQSLVWHMIADWGGILLALK